MQAFREKRAVNLGATPPERACRQMAPALFRTRSVRLNRFAFSIQGQMQSKAD
jgi:hypothetical protein